MKYLLLTTIVCLGAARLATSNPIAYLPYAFGYSTADGMSREESGSGGRVSGSYSYTDANGDLRQVRYVADENGFRPEGDISVDRKTAAAAAALAALAPKGTEPQFAAAPAPAWPAAPAAAPVRVAAYKSYNSFDNYQQHQAAAAVPVANWHQSAPLATALNPVAYQVDTPTHKIWVKY